MMNKELIVIAGPTGVGKTDSAIAIAAKLNTEIISADSRQIYREMSIGTAVPERSQLDAVPHHFIQNKSIHQYYNASDYEFEVIELLDSLFTHNDKVILTGGSGLYIDAVIKGIDDLPKSDPELRKQLQQRIDSEGLDSLRKELKVLDPVSYHSIDLKNPKRLQKAIEICLITGKPYSDFLKRTPKKRNFSVKTLALNMDRKELYNRINHRVIQMIDKGLVKEAELLLEYKGLNPLNTVGYKEIFLFLEDEISLERAIELIQNNSRKYARKQITWFRKDNQYKWFHPTEIENMLRYIEDE
ncbi:MAG: tRNA (adenosine(37)-N6)-dimethylallyltransferase MiaA [Bacteroidales bacterium]|nr:tRNA (adenosine(37)-N6)-dimethylallyltransferase MiaA [Bacteroidales bacterium]